MSDAGRAARGPAGTDSSRSLDERAELERLRAEASTTPAGRAGAGLGLAASMVLLGAGLLIFRGVYLGSVPSDVLPATAAHP